MGYGWGFGVHEALDQFGAMFGPLVVAAVLALRGQYQFAFVVLLIPALVTLGILLVARLTYPRPEEMETHPPDVQATGLPLASSRQDTAYAGSWAERPSASCMVYRYRS